MSVDLTRFDAFGGLDLAATRDLTSFALVWPVDDLIYANAWFWIPEDGIQERCRRDNVRYDVWADEGYLELTPGAVTDWRFVTDRIKQIAQTYLIREIGFDRYGARDTVADLGESGLTVADIPQGPMTFNAPCRRLEELVLGRKIRHNGNPVLRWNVDCCTVKADANANIRPVKPEHHKSSKRIDGVVALLMALSRAMAAEVNADVNVRLLG